jgi:endonuclease G
MAGCPTGSAGDSEIIVRQLFAAAINADNGLADWVAYRVVRDSVGVGSLLPRWWQQDVLLPTDALIESFSSEQPRFIQPDLNNAQGRSYRVNEIIFNSEDRGRLAPMSSFAATPFWQELNNISNMALLPNDLRTGSWARLEQAINALAVSEGELYVIGGPLYQISGPLNDRASEQNVQPSAYYKVITTANRHAAFIFDAELPIHARYCDQTSTVQQIERLSDLTLFPEKSQSSSPTLYSELGCTNTGN